MNKYFTLLIVGLLLVGIHGNVQSATITNTFIATVYSGPLSGEAGTGSFSYNDDFITVGDEEVDILDELMINFSFDGQDFNETNDADFSVYPTLSFTNFQPIILNYQIVNGYSGVDFNNPNLVALFTYDLIPSSGIYDFETELIAEVVPIPAAAWLFGSALIGLVGIRRKIQK